MNYKKKASLLFNTIKYLKFKQIYFRLYYLFRKKLFKETVQKKEYKTNHIDWKNMVFNNNSYKENYIFEFLNKERRFLEIDWNFSEYGKLWTYNLNYFDFLFQKDINKEKALSLIYDYIEKQDSLKDGIGPYPISLRGINWIKFISFYKIKDNKIDKCLYKHYKILEQNLEYHILGNHLLENGFSLLFASYYFIDDEFDKLANKILIEELNEQILEDGGHIEQSPMYHQIMLHRVLDCIALIKANKNLKNDSKELLSFLLEKAQKMLSWLSNVTYKNGNIPMVNDSTYDIAPTSDTLFHYANQLGIHWNKERLGISGYRKVEKPNYELFIDIGNITSSYQPGHTHSDTFSFELYKNQQPIIVDRGISTYEKNHRRQQERSTSSHNTIQVNNIEQSQVWGGFRVSKRAEVVNIIEKENFLSATHNGYKKALGILHKREFSYLDKKISISDELKGADNKINMYAYFHFYPDIENIRIEHNFVYLDDVSVVFCFDNFESLDIDIYDYCLGFNKTKKARKLIVKFKKKLSSTIIIKE